MHLVTYTTITHKKNALQYLYLRLQDTLAESSVSVQCSAPVACEFYGTLSYATHFYATSSLARAASTRHLLAKPVV